MLLAVCAHIITATSSNLPIYAPQVRLFHFARHLPVSQLLSIDRKVFMLAPVRTTYRQQVTSYARFVHTNHLGRQFTTTHKPVTGLISLNGRHIGPTQPTLSLKPDHTHHGNRTSAPTVPAKSHK